MSAGAMPGDLIDLTCESDGDAPEQPSGKRARLGEQLTRSAPAQPTASRASPSPACGSRYGDSPRDHRKCRLTRVQLASRTGSQAAAATGGSPASSQKPMTAATAAASAAKVQLPSPAQQGGTTGTAATSAAAQAPKSATRSRTARTRTASKGAGAGAAAPVQQQGATEVPDAAASSQGTPERVPADGLELEDLKALLAASQQREQALQQELLAAQAARSTAEEITERERLRADQAVSSAKVVAEELRARAKAADKQFTQMQQQIAEQQAAHTEATTALAACMSDVEQLKAANSSAEEEAQQLRDELLKVQSEFAATEARSDELAATQVRVQHLARQVQHLDEALEAARADAQQAHAEAEAAQAAAEEAAAAAEQAAAARTAVPAAASGDEEKQVQLQAQVLRLQGELSDTEAGNAALLDEHMKLKAALEVESKLRQEAEAKVQVLASAVQAAKDEAGKAQQAWKKAQADVNTLVGKLKASRAEAERLRGELSELSAAVSVFSPAWLRRGLGASARSPAVGDW